MTTSESAAPTDPLYEAPPVPVALVALWRQREGRIEILLTKRPQAAHLGGLWELPGGKVQTGETIEQAARRELIEEIGLRVGRLEPLLVVDHRYPQRPVRLHTLLAEVPADSVVRNLDVTDHRWIAPNELDCVECPEANAPINAALRARLAPHK
jgi:8-oxo-dGTP diphosphatase